MGEKHFFIRAWIDIRILGTTDDSRRLHYHSLASQARWWSRLRAARGSESTVFLVGNATFRARGSGVLFH